ncbi:hypothetical protein L195_g060571, partial [Trifolium pratense]
ISNEERLAFLAKARQQKANPAVAVDDPLKQLQVEEAVSKEGRSKKKHDGRIHIAIPGKENPAAEVPENEVAAPPPAKKQKVTDISQSAGGVAKDKGVASSSSQLPSGDAATAAPLSWSCFDPFEFIERGVTIG